MDGGGLTFYDIRILSNSQLGDSTQFSEVSRNYHDAETIDEDLHGERQSAAEVGDYNSGRLRPGSYC